MTGSSGSLVLNVRGSYLGTAESDVLDAMRYTLRPARIVEVPRDCTIHGFLLEYAYVVGPVVVGDMSNVVVDMERATRRCVDEELERIFDCVRRVAALEHDYRAALRGSPYLTRGDFVANREREQQESTIFESLMLSVRAILAWSSPVDFIALDLGISRDEARVVLERRLDAWRIR